MYVHVFTFFVSKTRYTCALKTIQSLKKIFNDTRHFNLTQGKFIEHVTVFFFIFRFCTERGKISFIFSKFFFFLVCL